MALTQVPPALLTSTTGTGSTVVLSASPTFTGTVTTPGVTFSDASSQTAAASPYVLKNRIINGAMQVWQRGTSITTSGAYTADRWTEVSGNSNQHIQSTDAPTNFGYSMQIIGVGANMNQRIESLNCQDLSGQTITVSFWIKNTSGTDGLILGLYYPNTADNFGSLTQIGSNITISSNPSSSWTQYTTTFTSLPAGSKNGLSLYLARLGTGAVSTTWYLTGVQLEIGSSATPFERRLYGQELDNCKRYYQLFYGFQGHCGSTTAVQVAIEACPEMRATPTASATGVLTVTDGAANYTQSSVGVGVTQGNGNGVVFTLSNFTGLTQFRPVINNSASNQLTLSAEL
jgi:hypothetical protein